MVLDIMYLKFLLMNKLKIYCMSLYNSNYEIIKNLGYIPVGLKNNDFSKNWLRDNTLNNISKKKILTMENIHFIIGIGKIFWI